MDFDPQEENSGQAAFDPRDYSAEELNLIEAALKLVQARQQVEGLDIVQDLHPIGR